MHEYYVCTVAWEVHGIKDSKTKRIQHYKSKVLKSDWISERGERERERERDWAHLGGTTFRRKTKLQHLPRLLICECSSNFHFSGNWSRPRIFLLLLQLLLLTSILPNLPKKKRQLGSRMTHKPPPPKKKKRARHSLGEGMNTSEQT